MGTSCLVGASALTLHITTVLLSPSCMSSTCLHQLWILEEADLVFYSQEA